MRKIGFILFILVVFTFFLSAQEVKLPKVSPGASVTQTIGLCDVTISYHRPGVKERKIWGDLVPYDKVWRAGANEATAIDFGCDVKVEGKKLLAGKYGFFVIPHQEKATIIFSKQSDIWGTYGYKKEMDVIRFEVKTEKAKFCEWMMFYFVDLSDSSATAVLHWENVMWKFKIEVDTQAAVMKSAARTFGRYWVPPYQAADYLFEADANLDKAVKWIGLSTKIEETYWNMFLKAKIYKKMAKTKADHKKALKTLEKAIMLGKKLTPQQQKTYVAPGEELLKTWKAKK
jgi:hypothetical protein